MNKRIEDEKQKQDLEYKMLQSQINPHFIYNTLSSIKWMATIQGADGIAEMTTALSRLLKSISKGTRLLVPIREELAFLEDYCTIQNYRYGGTISFALKVDDPTIYDRGILRFTLQPLVENSIFHGIEPKGVPGASLSAPAMRTAGPGIAISALTSPTTGWEFPLRRPLRFSRTVMTARLTFFVRSVSAMYTNDYNMNLGMSTV